jgi:hypothetical protein
VGALQSLVRALRPAEACASAAATLVTAATLEAAGARFETQRREVAALVLRLGGDPAALQAQVAEPARRRDQAAKEASLAALAVVRSELSPAVEAAQALLRRRDTAAKHAQQVCAHALEPCGWRPELAEAAAGGGGGALPRQHQVEWRA